MSKNIFENAKFGDKFRTRDGRKAVVDGSINGFPVFSVEGYDKSHGIIYISGDSGTTYLTPWIEDELKGCGDIIGKWHEPVSEWEIERLAREASKTIGIESTGRTRKFVLTYIGIG